MTVSFNRNRSRWVYDFEFQRQRRYGYCVDPVTGEPAKSKREAEKIETLVKVRLEREAGSGPAAPPGAMTLAEAADLFLQRQEGRHRENVIGYIREILGFFGAARAVTEIPVELIGAYKTWMRQQPVMVWKGGPERNARDPRWSYLWAPVKGRTRGAATCNRYLACLSGILDTAHRKRDPITGMPALPFPPEVETFDEPKRKPTPIADTELEAIEDAAAPWVVDAVELGRLFGLRRTEALQATVHWVDHAHRALRLPPEFTKGGDEELLPAGEAGWSLLLRLATQAAHRGQIHLVTWPGPGGLSRLARKAAGEQGVPDVSWRPLKQFRKAWSGAKAKAGLGNEKRRRVHDVRARFGTEVAREDRTGFKVRDALRHADIATSQAYVQLVDEDLRATIDRAGRERAGNPWEIGPRTKSLTEAPDGKSPKIKRVK